MVHQARQYILEHPSIKAKLRRLIEHLQQDIAVRESMRKIVHDAVGEIDGVRTSSEGEEPSRRVVISPES